MLSGLCTGPQGRKCSVRLLFVLPSAFGGGLGLLPQGARLLFLNTECL